MIATCIIVSLSIAFVLAGAILFVQTRAKGVARQLLKESNPDPKRLRETISRLNNAFDSEGKELHRLLLEKELTQSPNRS